jgi:hydrogenase expression/formation protein HypC
MCLAIPVRVVAVEGNVATVEAGGSRVKVRLDALSEPVQVGDYLLVHAGFAIKRLDPADAEETLRLWDELLSLSETSEYRS